MSDPAIDFSIEHATADGRSIVRLVGEFDLSVKATVDDELESVLTSGPPIAVIDLSGLHFIDSSGIHSLVLALRRSQRNGRTLYIVRGGPAVQRVLDLCGLEQRLNLVDDLADVPTEAPGALRGTATDSSGAAAA